jgi:GntR family carbon starvation induced transcriptional regulator
MNTTRIKAPQPVESATPARRAETLASAAYDRLRSEIISGGLAPGQKLHIQGLCDRYGIGLSPMREALNRVSRDGLVQQNDQRGFTVAPLSEEDLADLTLARCAINEIALRDSIKRGDLAWEEGILLAYHRMARTPRPDPEGDTGEHRPWSAAHRAFHAALIAACGSARLRAYCEDLFDAADRYRFLNRRRVTANYRRRDDHRPIMEAVLTRDTEKAVRLLVHHFSRTAEYGRDELRQLKNAKPHSARRCRFKSRKRIAVAGPGRP